MRTLSARAMKALYAASTGEVFLMLLEIDQSALDEPRRYVNSAKPITSNGHVYKPLTFALGLPDESRTDLPQTQLEFDNTDREGSLLFRSISPIELPTVLVRVVLADTPDIDELDPPLRFQMLSAGIQDSEGQCVCTLANGEALNEPFPGNTYNSYNYPGLYGTTFG